MTEQKGSNNSNDNDNNEVAPARMDFLDKMFTSVCGPVPDSLPSLLVEEEKTKTNPDLLDKVFNQAEKYICTPTGEAARLKSSQTGNSFRDLSSSTPTGSMRQVKTPQRSLADDVDEGDMILAKNSIVDNGVASQSEKEEGEETPPDIEKGDPSSLEIKKTDTTSTSSSGGSMVYQIQKPHIILLVSSLSVFIVALIGIIIVLLVTG